MAVPQITLNLPRQTAQIAIPGITEPRVVSGITIPVAPDNPVIGLDAPGERRRFQELRSQARLREEVLQLLEIESVEFGLYSTQDIDEIAVVNVTSEDDYGPKSVRDLKMGPQTNSQVCETCQSDLKGCPGHFGKLVFPQRLMHPLAVKSIEGVLSSVCDSCGGLLVTRSDLEAAGILRMRGEKRLQAIKELVKEMKKPCTRYTGREDIVVCTPNPIYLGITEHKEDYRLHYSYSAEKGQSFTLPPDVPPGAPPDAKSIYKILNNISVEDAELLGFSEESHPRNMVINRLIVIPYCARPDVGKGDRVQPDDFTFIYKAIVAKTNDYIRVSGNEAAAEKALMNLNFVVVHLMKNDGKYSQGGRRILGDISKRMQGKNGVIRQNLMGKRVNFAGRTVVGPGHNLRVDQIGVPRLMAEKLTRPIQVIEMNRPELQAKYDAKAVKHITMQSGRWAGERRAVTDYFEREFPRYRLQIGDIVERALQDDDIVIVNRQPTLHKQNMLAGRAKIIDDRILRINLSLTSPQNADYDGDEMNLHVPQTQEAYTEAEELLSIARNLIAPQTNDPIMAVVYDALSGAYAMTLPQHMVEEIPKKLEEASKKLAGYQAGTKEYERLESSMRKLNEQLESFKGQLQLNPVVYNYAVSQVMNAPQFDTLYDRLAKYGVNPYTGRGLISSAFPEDFDYDAGGVLIQEGIMIRGLLDKKIIGRSDGSVIQEMYKQSGGTLTVEFMSDIQFVSNAYLELRGLSVGIDDCIPADPNFRSRVEEIMTTASMTVRALSVKTNNKILEEQRERKIGTILEKAQVETQKLVSEHFDPRSAIMIMAKSGAKGSELNAIQMSAALGQQKVSSQRIAADLPGNRSLPIFRANDPDPRSRGLCFNSFMTGLDPAEFWAHSQGGRENLTDTAINTSQTGFLQHQIIKSAEDVHTSVDGSSRAIDDSIIQFVYGEDGMDAGELVTVKINGENVPFFRHIQQLASKINRIYGSQ